MALDPFTTVYKKDYARKYARRPPPCEKGNEFKDPITESFKSYLSLPSEEAEPSREDVHQFSHKHLSAHPKHEKAHFETPLDDAVVQKSFIYRGRTIYQVDYCDLEADEAYKLEQIRKNQFTLPEDWYVPLTTQKYSYRNPTLVNPRALQREEQKRPVNNLDPEQHIRKILKVRAGDSEYMGGIGTIGKMVIDEELHGRVVHEECKLHESHNDGTGSEM